jgi:ABC-type polysaccharide/polyol phosphate export permease
MWWYRELLYFFLWRDLKVRYKQTVIGVACVVLQPLIKYGRVHESFGRVALPSDWLQCPVFYFAVFCGVRFLEVFCVRTDDGRQTSSWRTSG